MASVENLNRSIHFYTNFMDRLQELTFTLSNETVFSIESLLDAFVALYMDCKVLSPQSEYIANFVEKYDKIVQRIKKARINTQDFEILKTLATGAVGKVCLVRGKSDRKIYAMKILKKFDLLTRREAAFFMEERNALVFAQSSVWMTALYSAFQDDDNLYLVMEYAPGGSLRSLLHNREEMMPEEEARFYIAEILVALEELHNMKFIHRDVKPENCLIDETGHVKLADFGSCMKTDDKQRIQSNETVGTPDYISPEILRAQEGNASYGVECDFWSLGIILYELLFDEVPFYSESLMETYGKIMNHKKHFAFPEDIQISEEAKDLILKLICDRQVRLGVNGAAEIKKHPWFKDIDWGNIRSSTPPFIPELNGPDDTRYFEDDEDESKKVTKKPPIKTKEYNGNNLPFVGYTYLKNARPTLSWMTSENNQSLSNSMVIHQPASAENEEIMAKLKESLKSTEFGMIELKKTLNNLQNEKSRMEGEIRELKSTNDHAFRERTEMELKLTQMKRTLERESAVSAELKEAAEHYKELEKQVSTLKSLVETERGKSKETEQKYNELMAQKDILDLEMKNLKQEVESEKDNRSNASKQVSEINSKFKDVEAKFDAVKKEKDQLTIQKQKMEAELKVLKGMLDETKASLNKANDANKMLEMDKAMLSVDIDRLQKKLSTIQAEKDAALKQDKSTTEDKSSNITALQEEVKDLKAKKEKITEELTEISKEKAVWQLELSDLKKSLDKEIEEHQLSKTKIDELLAKNASLADSLSNAEKACESVVAENKQMKADLEDAIQSAYKETQKAEEASEKLTEAVKKAVLLSRELNDVRSQLTSALGDIARNDAKMQELESQLNGEKKIRIQLEVTQSNTAQSNEDLHKEVERLEERIKTIMADHSKVIMTYEENLALTKKSQEGTEQECQQALTELEALQHEQEQKIQQIQHLEKMVQGLNRSYNQTHYELDEWRAKYAQMTFAASAHHSKHSSYIRMSWDTKHSDFDLTASMVGAGDTESTKDMSFKTDTKSVASFNEKSVASKFKNFFGTSRIKANQPRADHERAMRKLDEVTEEKDKLNASHHRKMSSTSSSSLHAESILSSATKLSEMHLSEAYFINGIFGWVKVPKFGKVRKGWKEQYAVVRDFKIYLFNREKDLDTAEGILLADLTMDVFYTRGVTQTELIHASAKEIDCIFKIQIGKRDVQTIMESAQSSEANMAREIKANIHRLREQVAILENSFVAIEKMYNVASDIHKGTLHLQMDNMSKEIQKHKDEVVRLENQLLTIDANVSHTVDEEDDAAQYDQDVVYHIQRLEKEIESHFKVKEELLKSVDKKSSPKKGVAPSALIESEAAAAEIDKLLIQMKEQLVTLRSNDKKKILPILEKMNEGVKIKKVQGHAFKLRKSLFTPKDCLHCHEAVWNKNVFECTGCKQACHKACVQIVDINCKSASSMKMSDTVYVMAKDQVDKTRWLSGLEYFRKEYLKQHSANSQSATSALPPTVPASSMVRIKTSSQNKMPHNEPYTA